VVVLFDEVGFRTLALDVVAERGLLGRPARTAAYPRMVIAGGGQPGLKGLRGKGERLASGYLPRADRLST